MFVIYSPFLYNAKVLYSTGNGVLCSTVTLVRLEHLENADSPMLVTELGIVTLVRPEQSKKAPCPILVTEFGMDTLVRLEQP